MLPTLKLTLYLLLALLLSGCDVGPHAIDSIRQHGELVVLTRNAPTTYYVDNDGLGAGMDHDLIMAFAEAHDLRVRFEIYDTVDELLDALKAGKGHIAAAGLTYTRRRSNRFLASEPYQYVSQQVVCRRNGEQALDIQDLSGISLSVISNSSYVTQLKALKVTHPGLSWQVEETLDTESLLEKVWRKKIDCTLADSNIVAINRRYHPELVTTFNLTRDEPVVWYMPRAAGPLKRAVNNWLEGYKEDGQLAVLEERYYGFVELFDYVDTKRFLHRIGKRLPQYKQHFISAAKKYELPWTLLAAQSYQESHWNRRAKSPTGVRGIMMLTLPTAREMGVKSRLNAKQNIYGGAKYLSLLREQLPEGIDEPDRTWFALAAYNIGMGHLQDARELALELEKNPDSWADMKEILPLLARKEYYKELKYGYARGWEPVRYVSRIRDYADILLQQANKLALTE